MFLKISQISQENNFAGDRYLIFQLSRPVTLLKDSPTEVFSCEICEIFKSIYLEEHLQTTASVLTLTNKKDSKKSYLTYCSKYFHLLHHITEAK